MRTVLLIVLAAVFFVSSAVAQIGPKVYDKPKPDSTKVKSKIVKPPKPKPDSTKVKSKIVKPPKSKPDSTKAKSKIVKPKPKPKPDPTKVKSKIVKPPKPKPEKTKPQPQKIKKETAAQSRHVKRFLFTTAIEEHEPIGNIDSLSTATEQVYCFTEIVGLKGQTITHRWKYKDEVQAEVLVTVGSPRWRAYSSKKFLRTWTGEWIVEVVNATGDVLASKRMVYYETD